MVAEHPSSWVPGSPGPSRVHRVRRLVLLAAASLVTAVGLYLAYVFLLPPSSSILPSRDPRLDYAGPFRNVDPDVRYVPEERCADCHLDIVLAYAEHPMARSLQPVAQVPAPGEPGHNPFEALGSWFRIDREGSRTQHRRTRLGPDGRPAAELEWEVHHVIGSGGHGRSYLTHRDGYLFQTPISWYTQKKLWDLSPGFGPLQLTGRAVSPDCFFCHTNRVQYVEGSVNRYTEPVFDGHGIGCQRCHGPGAQHVASREGSEVVPERVDHTIVNPRHLEPSLRDAVCEQCHLEGEARTLRRGRGLYDFRPGLPLELFWSVFVRASDAGEKRKAVGHVEQMYQSRCFQSGDGPNRLGCISCHDPHRRVPPAERVAHYRGRCLQCHEPQRCSLPQAERLRRTAADSCIDCHMPRYAATDIPHTAATDHRIPRDAKPAAPHGNEPPAAGAGLPLAPFYGDRKEADDREVARDLALALVTRARTGETSASRVLGRTLPLLDMALQRDPGDLPAGEARGYALGLLGRWPEALAAFEAVLAQAPERELALVGAASATEALGQKETSLGYWRRAVAANPWAPDYRRRLALLLVKEEAWDEARRECEAWVRLDPFSAEARSTRVLCLLAAGNKEEARAEFARITALAPPNLRELQERFARKLR